MREHVVNEENQIGIDQLDLMDDRFGRPGRPAAFDAPGVDREIAKLAVETCLWPMYEMENGEITQVRKIKDPRPVEEYLRTQKRFAHLFTMEGGEKEIKNVQAIADWNIKHYGLQ